MGLFGPSEITGIDIGAGAIKVVRIADGKHPKLLSAAVVELPLEDVTPDLISRELRALLSAKKIGKNTVVTQVPGKDLTIRSLTMPAMPHSELAEAIRWEAKRHVSFPLDAALVEYLVTGEKKEGMSSKYDILLVAAEKAVVEGHLVPFRDAGIKVSVVDANPLALRNALRLRKTPEDQNTLLVDIGAGKTEINIFNKYVLRFSRCLETGGLDMTRAIADQMGVSLPEAESLKQKQGLSSASESDATGTVLRGKLDALLMEIRRSVEYYKTTFREKSVEGTIITGGVSLMPGIREYFYQALESPVELDNPFQNLPTAPGVFDEFGSLGPRFSTAVGLALRKG